MVPTADPRLVLITDRRLMAGPDLASGDPVERFAAAIRTALRHIPPGAAIIQVREKDLDGRSLLALVRAAVVAAPDQLVMVNDRVDVALAAQAHGVHLPEAGFDPIDARAVIHRAARVAIDRLARAAVAGPDHSVEAGGGHRLPAMLGAEDEGQRAPAPTGATGHAGPEARDRVPTLLLGASRHSPADAARVGAAGADLIQLGPIWSTPSKRGLGEPLGPSALTAARRAIPAPARLIAVGGIDGPARARAARAAGADAIAVIRAVWGAPDPAAAAAELL